ncbi:DNA alkylation repair enzyme [Glaciihabitans tibetensis]|uniref:DNA alkylation repair enzyme n=1 Tax=Glaciihabitans tibetensis TaxID=1266600 RepID=A0A2T0VE51_9MICO|nr:DNA alkylation repair protein [Glaciihabitans tibetensis]PRY68466.1 DNA alkylation repair enzyme [Glaciihabitans tibetensis]
MSDAGDFVDAALQYEGDWYRGDAERERLGVDLRFYGASMGAVRGTVRDAARKFPGMAHDEITSLSSELWSVPVYERRLAAVVLLQSNVRLLHASDLTRIESFVRTAGLAELVDPLAHDVIAPLLAGLDAVGRRRADAVLDRWHQGGDPWLRRASAEARNP